MKLSGTAPWARDLDSDPDPDSDPEADPDADPDSDAPVATQEDETGRDVRDLESLSLRAQLASRCA